MNKILNLLVILCLVFFWSCSDDSGVIDIPEREKKLLKIEHYAVYPSGLLYLDATTTFENDRPVLTQYSNDGQVWKETIYTYSQVGLLTELKTIIPNTNDISMHSAVYDAQNRIIEYSYSYSSPTQGSGQSELTFSYGDNTITSHYNDGDRINHLNGAGKIYKISVDGQTFWEFEYEGNNITKFAESSYERTFTYNNEYILKGNYLKYKDYIYGGKNNRLLFHSNMNYPWAGDKYLIHEQSNEGPIRSFSYDFDEDGYPVAVYKVDGIGPHILFEKIYYE